MDEAVFFWMTIAVILTLIAAWAVVMWRASLRPYARNLLLVLIAAEVVLTALHTLIWRDSTPPFWAWFLNLNVEYTAGAVFSSVQLILIGWLALFNGVFTSTGRRGERAYWLLLMATFFFLGYDEYYQIHETLISRDPTEFWRIPYAIAGLIIAAISAVVWWRFYRRRWMMFTVMFGGLVIMMLGGIFLEAFTWEAFVDRNVSERLAVLEESTEMIGATIALSAFLLFAQDGLTERGWRWLRSGVLAGAAVWTVWLCFALLLQPQIETQTIAQATDVQYADGNLSLAGFRLSDDVFAPGDEVAVTVYWRASGEIPEDYNMSMHMLLHPELESVVQSDDLHAGPFPSTAFFPGVTNKRTTYIDIPADVPTPGSYSLTLRLWSGSFPYTREWIDSMEGLPVSESDRQLLADDTVVLDRFAILDPDAAPEPPAIDTDYRFADGFTLAGYEVDTTAEADGGGVNAAFRWTAQNDVQRDLTQFVHLLDADGNLAAGFDQPPFAGHFLTADWTPGMDVVDKWTVPLPDDLPAGEYSVYTGLYDPVTVERAPVVDGEDVAVPNNAIPLGVVTVEE